VTTAPSGDAKAPGCGLGGGEDNVAVVGSPVVPPAVIAVPAAVAVAVAAPILVTVALTLSVAFTVAVTAAVTVTVTVTVVVTVAVTVTRTRAFTVKVTGGRHHRLTLVHKLASHATCAVARKVVNADGG
jgi:hypothetical protein